MYTRRVPKLFIVLSIASVLFLLAAQPPNELTSLEEFLLWASSSAGAMWLAGYVIAYVLENLAFWHGLPRWVKFIVPWVLAALIGSGSTVVLGYDLVSYIPEAAKTVILMLLNWLFSQFAYKGIKNTPYAASARLRG